MTQESVKTYSIGDVLRRVKQRIVPFIAESASLDELIDAFERSRHSKILYVVDSDKHFLGIVDFKDVSQHILFHYHEPKLNSRHLISIVTSEYAKDFIKKQIYSATMDSEYEKVLEEMLRLGVDEIPILDNDRRLVADLTIVDMIDFYMHITGRDQLGITSSN